MNSQLFSKIKIRTNYNRFFVFIFIFLFVNQSFFAQNKEFIVVLDAGHGGKDPGKVNNHNAKEKEIALSIVLRVGKLLEADNNLKVVYTRKTDVFVDLWERGRIANKADANLFVSIHCNAHNSQASGAETWVLGTHANSRNFEVAKAENSVILLEDNYKTNYKGFDPNSPESVIGLTLMQEEYLDQSIQLASIIQHGFTTKLNRVNRGVKQAGFVVLHQTYMPSVLIETGFITNNEEGAFLNSDAGQQKFAESIYKGIIKYKEQLTLNTVSNVNLDIAQVKKRDTSKPAPTKSTEESNFDAEFKVQIASGSRKLETQSYNFNGLENVERIQFGSSYKYFVGGTSDYSKIKEVLQLAKSKGYTSAFIVAFKNGDKISVDDILKKS